MTARGRLRLQFLCCVFGLLTLFGGCRSRELVRTPQSQPPPPQAPIESGPGTVSVDLSRPAGAEQTFKPEATASQRFNVHLDLGKVFENQGNYEAALLEYQEALAVGERSGIGKSRSRDEALAHRRLGNALDGLGRFSQAEVHYKKALKLDPHNVKIWNDAGYSYYLQGRWADAEGTLQSAARLAPGDMRIKTNLGLTLAAVGRSEEALALLSQYSGDAIGHANLGYLLAATGQTDLARREYEQALAMRPNLDQARRALDQLSRSSQSDRMLAAAPPLPTIDLSEFPPPSLSESESPPPRDVEVRQTAGVRAKIPPPHVPTARGVNP
ncbi:MAG: tetratricopeptide repeat protein [Paludisphaera borealis]|uniref:tetratricopeptide repeat protein n=1 Tax=Paludisphaera borealis TaxID=1387353 RepID=UPI002847028E|nr:tetratricopeptide repeat protein [Paludisphaera borealis]MDR3618020.1 tetratricopeptide repeat protein [Paludisphaera borealis]